jgi:lipopolysaccharide transport system ATP-binding protein
MSETVIHVEGLGKRYRVGERERYFALRDVLARAVIAPFRRNGQRRSKDYLWALRDVSFDVQQGEVVGLIGRNGAGKTTLLKILSRITRPTAGYAEIRGRVGSLLEVGTGFHPELTGRENVYLSGAVLGMKRAEIGRKFDEIVAFAEVERFLDTPLKHFSTGMQMRLAFAVAAHLEPEILLVDEVLAVGDMAFQKKCLGKMEDVAKTGRTVLFVSHNMGAVTRLCQRGILLDEGRIIRDSNVLEVASQYLNSGLGTSAERRWASLESSPGNAVVRLRAVRVISEGVVSDNVDIRKPVTVEMEFYNFREGAELLSAFSFLNDQGAILFVSADFHEQRWGCQPRPVGIFRARCTVPGNLLAEGQVLVTAEVSTRHPNYEIHFLERDSVSFQIIDRGEPGSVRGNWGRNFPGVVRPFLLWENEHLDRAWEAE